jgi:hypothetical protein
MSGSRLRAQVADGGQGAVVFEGWMDTKLNELCEFHPMKDGSVRCVPVFGGPRLVYTDAECKSRAAAVDQACDIGSARFVTSLDESNACPTSRPPVSVYSLGAPLGNATAYYRDERGNCAEYGARIPLVSVKEAPVESFVAASLTREDIGDGFSVSVLQGEDGSRILDRIHDPAGSQCWPAILDDGTTGEAYPCLPDRWTSVADRGPYADAACGEPLAELPMWCPKPSLAVVDEGPQGVCAAPRRTVREVLNAVTPTELYTHSKDGDACHPAGAAAYASRGKLYELGEPVIAESFPALTWAAGGEGRLRSRYWATPSGAQAGVPQGSPRRSGFYDEVLKSECFAAQFEDGSTRCVPTPSKYLAESEFFDDPDCERPLKAELIPDGQCVAGDTILFAEASADSSSCLAGPPLKALYTIGEPFAGQVIYYRNEKQKCQEWGDASSIYTLKPVAPSTYAEIAIKVE